MTGGGVEVGRVAVVVGIVVDVYVNVGLNMYGCE